MTAVWRVAATAVATASLALAAASPGADIPASPGISRTAADACNTKLLRLQSFPAQPEGAKKQTTQFSEAEVNSYLALELSAKYHPSLKSLQVRFKDPLLEGTATIDFDQLGMSAKGMFARLFAWLFSGTHKLNVRGRLRTVGGKGNFELDEAQFDSTTLPNFLVEEVITAVGRKQKPPFDPMKPSQLPWSIDHVDVRAGQIVVHQ